MSRTTHFVTHLVRTQGLGLLALLLVLTGGAAYAAAAKDSVISRSIKDGQVKTRDLKDNAVQSGKLGADAVTTDKIAANAVTGNKLAAGSVTADKLAPGSVTGAKIPDETLTGYEIAPDSLYANDLATDSVGATELKGSNVVIGTGLVLPPDGVARIATVTCPTGQQLTGGGSSSSKNARILDSAPSLSVANRWELRADNHSNETQTVYAWAVCLPA